MRCKRLNGKGGHTLKLQKKMLVTVLAEIALQLCPSTHADWWLAVVVPEFWEQINDRKVFD